MNKSITLSIMCIFLLICVYSAEGKQDKPSGDSSKKSFKIKYIPPLRGKPSNRVGGGTRGAEETPILAVLVPDHVGLTIQKQPYLYWYISKPTKAPIEFTLKEKSSSKLLIHHTFNVSQSGIQFIKLSDYNVELSSDVQYSWTISMKDVFVFGEIKRIELSSKLSNKLAKAKKDDLPYIYAQEGIWYDALQALSELIDSRPDDKELYKERVSLLRQVGFFEFSD